MKNHRVFVIHMPREKDGDSSIGFCGRYTDDALRERLTFGKKPFVERMCSACSRIAAMLGTLGVRIEALQAERAELADAARIRRVSFARDYPALSYSEIQERESQIAEDDQALRKIDRRLRELRAQKR